MGDYVWILAAFPGIPGLILGILVGLRLTRRRWVVVLAIAGAVAAVVGLSQLPDDPDDDDPFLGIAIVTVTNVGGWALGLAGGSAARRRRVRSDAAWTSQPSGPSSPSSSARRT